MATFSMFFNGGNGVAFSFVMNDMAGRESERDSERARQTVRLLVYVRVCGGVLVDAVADAAVARWVGGGRLVGGCLVVYDDGGGGPLSPLRHES